MKQFSIKEEDIKAMKSVHNALRVNKDGYIIWYRRETKSFWAIPAIPRNWAGGVYGLEEVEVVPELEQYRIEMTNKVTGKKEVRYTWAENKKLAKLLIWTREDIISQWKINKIEEV